MHRRYNESPLRCRASSSNRRRYIRYHSPPTSSSESERYTETSDEDSGARSSTPPAVLERVVIWVKDKPFEFGTIPVYPAGNMSLPILMKVVAYCKEKGWLEKLSLGTWYHICKSKLRLSYHIGWTYIRLFNILFQQMDRMTGDLNENGQWDERCNTLKSKKYDRNDDFQVPTMQFLLFLFIQHSYRMMSKYGPPPPSPTAAEGVMSVEEIQSIFHRESDSSDDEFDEMVMEREEKKIIDEQLQFKFVTTHLALIIRFLETGDQKTPGPRLELETVDVLDLILCAATAEDMTLEAYSLKELIMYGRFAGYDESSHTVDRKLFISWVKQSLRENPWAACSGFLKWPIPDVVTGLTDEFSFVHSRRENRVMSNKRAASICWYTISNVSNQLLYLDHIVIQSDIRLYKCSGSFIYLTGSFSCVAVEWCRDMTIFLGCVSGVLRLTGCRGIRLVGLARQIIVNETVLSTFHVHTPCAPLLAGHANSQLHFGPYTSFYPNLKMDMRLAKLSPVLSQWDKVHGISYDGLHVNCEHQWTRIEGRALQEFCFPFNVSGCTISTPIILQARHAWSLEKKQRNVRKWTSTSSLFHDFQMNPAQSKLFLSILLQRFTKFLLDRNCQDEIMALVSYNEALTPEVMPGPRQFKDRPTSLEDVLENLLFTLQQRSRATFLQDEESDPDWRPSTVDYEYDSDGAFTS